MSSKTRQTLEAWIKTKKVSGKVLDVGGSQLPIKGRIQKDEATEFFILDLENPHETKQKPDIICDLNEVGDINYHHEDFDFAVCLEVSEYWWDPVNALESIWFMLKPGGRLFISFHFIYPVHNPINADMLRYTRMGAMKLLEESGFEVMDIKSRKGVPSNLGGLYLREQMRPARGYDFHDEVGVLIEARKK